MYFASQNRDGFCIQNALPVTRIIPNTFRKLRRSIIAASSEGVENRNQRITAPIHILDIHPAVYPNFSGKQAKENGPMAVLTDNN
ncbi:hypothetical protein DT73_15010 [Mangrovibacter sp. MFB070]|uniref:hypothetical protein n=1 Tax=Mangrovibacter sp. MFB070 TaxID=1224318 RepID=UPI0004D8E79D|nr:hypothetical protein [Mangrovibacter sp. MFB070]KEA52203.1 hypothetical protein DT73_15010 [Mangrovibacter sp. MFB070]